MKNKIFKFKFPGTLFYLFCIISVQAATSEASAQHVAARLDASKIVIGDQVKLHLKLSDVDPSKTYLNTWFSFEDSSGHLQRVHADPLDSIEYNGRLSYLQTITLTSFDSGTWRLPPLFVVLKNRANAKTNLLSVMPDSITVLPVDVSDMKEYHDVKPIIEVEKKPDYLLYILIVISLLIVITAARFFLKKQKAPREISAGQNPSDTLRHALDRLNKLSLPEEKNRLQVKDFYSTPGEIGKEYLKQRFGIAAEHFTTDELIMQMALYLQKEPFKSRFYQLLRLQDIVKFARFLPSESINDASKKDLAAVLIHIHDFNKTNVTSDAQ